MWDNVFCYVNPSLQVPFIMAIHVISIILTSGKTCRGGGEAERSDISCFSEVIANDKPSQFRATLERTGCGEEVFLRNAFASKLKKEFSVFVCILENTKLFSVP